MPTGQLATGGNESILIKQANAIALFTIVHQLSLCCKGHYLGENYRINRDLHKKSPLNVPATSNQIGPPPFPTLRGQCLPSRYLILPEEQEGPRALKVRLEPRPHVPGSRVHRHPAPLSEEVWLEDCRNYPGQQQHFEVTPFVLSV